MHLVMMFPLVEEAQVVEETPAVESKSEEAPAAEEKKSDDSNDENKDA